MTKKEFLLLLDEIIQAKRGTLSGSELLADISGWDSMAKVEFIALVDEQFGVLISAPQLARSVTVDDLITLIDHHLIVKELV